MSLLQHGVPQKEDIASDRRRRRNSLRWFTRNLYQRGFDMLPNYLLVFAGHISRVYQVTKAHRNPDEM